MCSLKEDVGMTVRAHRRRLLYTAATILRRRDYMHHAFLTGLVLVALGFIFAVLLVLQSATLRSRLSTCCAVIASEAWYTWRCWSPSKVCLSLTNAEPLVRH
jgi:hypothetical protein